MSRYRRSRKDHRNSNNNASKIIMFAMACIIGFLLIKNLSPNGSANSTELTSGDYDAVCFVAGNVANSPEPDFSNAESIISDVFEATTAGEIPNVCMYSATTNPYSIEIEDKYLSAKGQNESATASQLKKLIRGINEAAKTAPSEGGANYYEAILQAANYLESNGAENPVIIVYGSGLSDTGSVNFAFDNLLSQDNGYITNKLSLTNIRKNSHSSVELKWLGVGQTVNNDTQAALSETWKNKVQDVYSEALSYVGITPEFKAVAVSDSVKSVSTEFYVNPTQIPEEVYVGFTLSLNENIAKFEANQAFLLNETEVSEKLTSFAKNFNASSNDKKIKLTGYQTSVAQKSGDNTLSIERANTIKNILVNLGIDSAKIIVDGVAGPQDDRDDSTNNYNNPVATEHRTVIVEVVEE